MALFSIYAHIPWCRIKCPYCDFNVHRARQWPEAKYTRALIAELSHHAQHEPWRGGTVRSVFFGGGTPSLFEPRSIAEVIAAIDRLWGYAGEPEITLEANPGTVDTESLRAYRSAGVNRISLGIQSFQPDLLATLGRDHSAEEALAAVAMAREAALAHVSCDLIFAVPGETLPRWEHDLAQMVALAPDHVSAYGLTYEERTAFHVWRGRGRITPVTEDDEARMFVAAEEILTAGGYVHYEISNYARPGHECLHNLGYWRGGEYLGIGAGAHSYSRHPGAGRRWSNVKHPAEYMRRIFAGGQARDFEEELSPAQARGEFVFLGLRTRTGVAAAEFAERFGSSLEEAFPHLESLRREGLLVRSAQGWALSERGRMVADSVFASFV